jgi:hypothetical protein
MKQIRLFGFFISLLFMFTACAVPENPMDTPSPDTLDLPPASQGDGELLNFEEAITISTDIISATYINSEQKDIYNILEFKVDKIIKGKTNSEFIYLLQLNNNVGVSNPEHDNNSIYKSGETYLLTLQRKTSVFYEHDYYTTYGDIFIPLADISSSKMYDVSINQYCEYSFDANTTLEDLTEYINNQLAKAPFETPVSYGTHYTNSEDLKEIIKESEFVFQVMIGELDNIGVLSSSELYYCEITRVLKGNMTEDELDAKYKVRFFSREVISGEEYIVLVNRSDATSIIFVVSSKNSVYPLDKLDMISEAIAYETNHPEPSDASEECTETVQTNNPELTVDPEQITSPGPEVPDSPVQTEHPEGADEP